jgi:FRG domain
MGNTRMKVPERAISSWNELRDVLEELSAGGWTFRGQADATWPLETSLTRYLRTYVGRSRNWPGGEARALRIFQRTAHLLLPRTPAEDETLEWLAHMQHHGAPTRLLDFTFSPYVAAFFALERATTHAAIWTIFPNDSTPFGSGRDVSTLLRHVMGAGQVSENEKIPIAVIGEPLLKNQRMTIQQGTFVIPIRRIDLPLESVLPKEAVLKLKLVKGALRKQTMRRLYDMNITPATLFPGVDGLARSLAFESELRWSPDPDASQRIIRDKSNRARRFRQLVSGK